MRPRLKITKGRFWFRLHTRWVKDGMLSEIKWRNDEIGKKAAKTAALQLYLVLNMHTEEISVSVDETVKHKIFAADITYNKLSEITGLSRSLVSQGLKTLTKLRLIISIKVGNKNVYKINNYSLDKDWAKFPDKAIKDKNGQIQAFHRFTLREKNELYALKLLIFIAYVRDNKTKYSECTYRTISENTAIPEANISEAYSYLCGNGLLAMVEKDYDDEQGNKNKPNRYYLKGYAQFFQKTAPKKNINHKNSHTPSGPFI